MSVKLDLIQELLDDCFSLFFSLNPYNSDQPTPHPNIQERCYCRIAFISLQNFLFLQNNILLEVYMLDILGS